MSDQESSSPIVVEASSPSRYDQRVKELAFVHYVLMDRHPLAAHRSMLEVWDDDLGIPPTTRTVSRWAREENWSYKADVEMSKMYPQLFQRDMARMVALRGRAISAYSKVLAGEHVPNSMAVAQIARHILEQTLGGLAVQTPQSADSVDLKSLDVGDLASRQRERLEAARG